MKKPWYNDDHSDEMQGWEEDNNGGYESVKVMMLEAIATER